MSTTGPKTRGADEVLLAFAHALRAAGVPVTHDRSVGFLAAAAALDVEDRQATYWAGRATLCGSPDDLERYDQVFTAYFDPRGGLPRTRSADRRELRTAVSLSEDDGVAGSEEADDAIRAAASGVEVLRHRDVATLEAGEKQRLAALYARLRPTAPTRRTARHRRWHRGDLDATRTLRNTLRRLGEPGDLAWRRQAERPRRIVLLIDVSGSMSGYADALIRLAHRYTQALGPGVVETFTVGTRLTHLTRALRQRDSDRAIVAAGDAVPDWSGGTRLGETLQVFLDRWGRRGMARGAVVVVFSDGWERGTPDQLREQMARLRRVAHRVVWVNPHRGKVGYEPVQQGVLAVLPFCDDFVAGHSMAAFEELTKVVARA